jgi:hypothetical protein
MRRDEDIFLVPFTFEEIDSGDSSRILFKVASVRTGITLRLVIVVMLC